MTVTEILVNSALPLMSATVSGTVRCWGQSRGSIQWRDANSYPRKFNTVDICRMESWPNTGRDESVSSSQRSMSPSNCNCLTGMFNDTIVDTGHGTFTGNCRGLGDTQGSDPGIYTGDFNLVVQNSTGNAKTVDFTSSFCAETLELWQQQHAGQDIHSATCSNANGECSAARMLAMARTMMWDGQ